MHFWVINEHKTIIFFSSKCGSTTIYTYMKLYYNDKSIKIYSNPLILNKRDNIKDFKNYKMYKGYNLILIGRNPYHKLVSGFLDKYVGGIYKNPNYCNNFEDFVNLLTKNKNTIPKDINKSHFKPQTKGKGFDLFNLIKDNNNILIVDIKDINIVGNYINLKDKNLVSRERSVKIKLNKNKLWTLEYKELKNKKLNYDKFYNDDLKEKVYHYYKKDFEFFKTLNYN